MHQAWARAMVPQISICIVNQTGAPRRWRMRFEGISATTMPAIMSWFPTLTSLVVIPRSVVMVSVRAFPMLLRSS